MRPTYIKFRVNKESKIVVDKPKSWLARSYEGAVITILAAILPNVNQGISDKWRAVGEWLVEINEDTGIAEREIGIDSEGKTIMAMPAGRSHGYWTANHLKLIGFADVFQASKMTNREFAERWEAFKGTSA